MADSIYDIEVYNSIKKYLVDKGNFRPADMFMIDKIPYMLMIIYETEKIINMEGVIIEDNKGNLRKNPALEVHSLYLNKIREYFVALGITPKERRKLEEELNDIKDDFDDDE